MEKITTKQEFEVENLQNSLEAPPGIVNFADTKQMIFKSFVQLQSYYRDIPLIFKTLNDNELYKIKALSGNEENPQYLENLNTYYFLHSIYMIGDVNVLTNRQAFMTEARNLIKTFHPRVYNMILTELFKLGQRANESIKLVERYSFEPDSRWLWMSTKGTPLTAVAVSGIPGTVNLGYNICQLLWSYYNRVEDEKNDFDKMWASAKMIAAAINPKGIKKLNQADENRKKEEKAYRESIIYGKDYKPRFKVQSKEDLVDELEKQMSGVKDRHDEIIERYLKKGKYEKVKEQKMIEEKLQSYTKTKGGKNLLVDYDPEAVRDQFKHKRLFEQELSEEIARQRTEELKHQEKIKTSEGGQAHYMSQQLTSEDMESFENEGIIDHIAEKFNPNKEDETPPPMNPEVFINKMRRKR